MQYSSSLFRGPRARFLAASSAAVLIVVGLGAGVMLPHPAAPPAKPQIVHAAMTGPVRAAPPRMLENGAPFSFADLVERVSPAVVTVTVEEQLQPSAGIDPSQLPGTVPRLLQPVRPGRPAAAAQSDLDGLGLHHRQGR